MKSIMRLGLVVMSAFCAFVASAATTYTWSGGGDGASWTEPANWGKTAEGDYPKTKDHIAAFATDATAVLPEELEISQLNVAKGATVTIKSADGTRSSLSIGNKIVWSDTGSGLTLDGVTCRVTGNVQPVSGGRLLLKNAASLYCALMEVSNTSESYITLTESVRMWRRADDSRSISMARSQTMIQRSWYAIRAILGIKARVVVPLSSRARIRC